MSREERMHYEKVLGDIERLLPSMSCADANALLDNLFEVKPVRLKWYIVKAKLMLKEGASYDEILAVLEDKCCAQFLYEGVEEYFELMCYLFREKGDLIMAKKWRYQLNTLLDIRDERNDRNVEVDERILALEEEIVRSEGWPNAELCAELAGLYYISSNIYAYVLLRIWCGDSLSELYGDIRTKYNVRYYINRLNQPGGDTFVLVKDKKANLTYEVLTKILKAMGHDVYLLEDNIECGTIDRIARECTGNELVMVLASGERIDELALDSKWKPRMERLSITEADYFEDRVAVARYGDYLSYIANLYRTDRESIRRALYREPTCKFSLVIPCRNAGETLRYTLKTCLEQDYDGDYEIVVCDNSAREYGDNTPTLQMCKDMKDDRIKYYRTPIDLLLQKSFEYAFLQTRGEFVIFLGADDGICLWTLKELARIIDKKQELPFFLWHEAFYQWSNTSKLIMNGGGKSILMTRCVYEEESERCTVYRTKDLFEQAFDTYGTLYRMPQFYHNMGVRRAYLQTLYQKTGALWGIGPQDIGMATVTSNVETEICFLENLYTIMGISDASIGANARVAKSSLAETRGVDTNQMSTYAEGYFVGGFFTKLFPGGDSEIVCFYTTVMGAHWVGVISDEKLSELDFKKMYKNAADSFSIRDLRYEAKAAMYRCAASKLGGDFLKWYDDNIYDKQLDTVVRMEACGATQMQSEETQFIQICGERITADKGAIDDVFKVAHLLKNYYVTKTNR